MKMITRFLVTAGVLGTLLAANVQAAVVFEDDFTAALPVNNSGVWQNSNRPRFVAVGGTDSFTWDGNTSEVLQLQNTVSTQNRTGLVTNNNVVSNAQLADPNSTITAQVTFGPTSLTGGPSLQPQTRLTLTAKQAPSGDFYSGVHNIEGAVQVVSVNPSGQIVTIGGNPTLLVTFRSGGNGVNGTQHVSAFLTPTAPLSPGAGDIFSYTISSTQLLAVTYYSVGTNTTFNLVSSPMNLDFIGADMTADFPNGARLGLVHWEGQTGGTTSSSWNDVQVQVNTVPEPATLGLMALGGMMMATRRNK